MRVQSTRPLYGIFRLGLLCSLFALVGYSAETIPLLSLDWTQKELFPGIYPAGGSQPLLCCLENATIDTTERALVCRDSGYAYFSNNSSIWQSITDALTVEMNINPDPAMPEKKGNAIFGWGGVSINLWNYTDKSFFIFVSIIDPTDGISRFRSKGIGRRGKDNLIRVIADNKNKRCEIYLDNKQLVSTNLCFSPSRMQYERIYIGAASRGRLGIKGDRMFQGKIKSFKLWNSVVKP